MPKTSISMNLIRLHLVECQFIASENVGRDPNVRLSPVKVVLNRRGFIKLLFSSARHSDQSLSFRFLLNSFQRTSWNAADPASMVTGAEGLLGPLSFRIGDRALQKW